MIKEQFTSLIQNPLITFITLLENKAKKMEIAEKEELDVEEVDQKIILCPHSKETYAINIINITVYSHKDDKTYCKLMNSFATASIVIIQEMALSRKIENTATMRSLLSTSLIARKRLYEKLSDAKDNDLAELLELTIKMYNQTRRKNELVQELIVTFGWPVIRNIKLLFQIDESSKYSSQSRYLPMQQLTSKHIVGIKEIIQEATQKRAQSIDDILYL